MKAVVYVSYTGESRRVASHIATQLDWMLCNAETVRERSFERLVLVFPVHCQNIPAAAKLFLSEVTCGELALIATYGRMWHGNVLQDIQRHFAHTVIAAAYVPTKHSYLEGRSFEAFEQLEAVLKKLGEAYPSEIRLPRMFRNPLSWVVPRVRSQLGVKMTKTDACTRCGMCAASCPTRAMQNGTPNNRCIRCLRCVTQCPQKAVRFALRLPMRWYLKKTPHEDVRVYI